VTDEVTEAYETDRGQLTASHCGRDPSALVLGLGERERISRHRVTGGFEHKVNSCSVIHVLIIAG
jgi:hypothetical protein